MDNLNDIISSLSADDINMLKGVASSILGEDNGEAKTQQQSKNNSNSAGAGSGGGNNVGLGLPALSSLGINADDFNMMMKAKTIFDKMNSMSDKNTDLILALKPHLSPESRNKADMAIKILRLFDILPLLKDLF